MRKSTPCLWAVGLSVCLVAGWSLTLTTVCRGAEDPSQLFREHLAPVLSAKCVSCHRPDNLKGGLNLTTRDGWLAGGESGTALVPEKPGESPAWSRAVSQNGAPPEMPEKGEPLTAVEAEELRKWIASGAPWPTDLVLKEGSRADRSFWSLQQLVKQDAPRTAGAPDVWQQSAIDRWVYARLQAAGLTPNPPATPRTFLRRISYDVIGLPPTPAEIDAFDRACQTENGYELSDAAVAEVVERLLASPHYGEHWGRHWLDVIRFGESRGFERNQIITNLWPFRDYIIRSFNDDKPFDRLIVEHLAGDVVGAGQPEIEIGSAFLVAGPYDDVGNQDAIAAAQIRADQMDEMIRATGEAFLGLTIGCARCHDHKFDPILTRDYYAFYATFAGTVHGEREVATPMDREARRQRLAPLEARRAELLKQREAAEQELARQARELEPQAAQEWVRPKASRYGTEEVFEPITARFVRLTAEGTDAPGGNPNQFRLDEFEVWTAEPEARNVALASNGGKAIGAARSAKDFGGAYGVDLVIDGKLGERWQAAGPTLVLEFAEPSVIHRVLFSSDRTRALGEDYGLTTFVGEYRIDVSVDGESWTTVATSDDRVPATDHLKLARLLKRVTTPEVVSQRQQLSRELAEIDAEIAKVPSLPVWWVGTHRAAPGPFQVFIGGDPQKKGDAVQPTSLQVLHDLPSRYELPGDSEEGARRLALAEWMTSSDNPLTPRVLANRVWHYHFGTGVVDTPSDFGDMGGRPTHPELLDYLAQRLLDSEWKLKSLHREILLSQTYRQSSAAREAALRSDADSRLLWRFPPRRLTAEEIRDTLLQVAGRLDLTPGGPGYRLYEYQQDNVATYVPLDVHGPETYRRGVYHHHARAARVDVMTDFDCPDPAFAEPRRASTITPLQALTMLNHTFSLDMADGLAARLQAQASTPEDQLTFAFRLAYAREPHARELQAGVALIEQHGLRAFCRALLNSNELISLR